MSLKFNDSWSCPRCKRHLEGLMLLDAQDRRTVAHALSIAAGQFDEDAKNAHAAGLTRVARQFEKQARDSRELLGKVEQ